ncbi:MAG: DNA polymerase III subunit chi [Methylovulum sp.]|jgi:DNA polymerase-3 subunit chi|nr:DNA polymerase III subunit chi [Methylovulum sp.]TSA40895.1 MAG: DNA polymerase III subunit chi [Methylococcaceae bacterium]
MPAITFYLVNSTSERERYQFACKLIEKSFRHDIFCYVLTDSAAQSQLLDDLLWTFRSTSFIPHQRYEDKKPEFERLVLIGSNTAPTSWHTNIINLSSQCPENFLTCKRLFEIIDNDPATKDSGRQRYNQYKTAGVTPSTHTIA